MNIINSAKIKGKILHKLLRCGKIEASHTAVENLYHGFPRDKVGFVKECIKDLMKEGIIFCKQTSYGLQVSVNLEKADKIKEYIRIYLFEDDEE